MKTLGIIIILIAVLGQLFTLQEASHLFARVKSKKGKCIALDGELRNVGDTWQEANACVQHQCSKYGPAEFFEVITRCPSTAFADDPSVSCRVENPIGNFPDCCPNVYCEPANE